MTIEEENLSALHDSRVLEKVRKEKLLELAKHAEARSVPAHTMIFREGDPADSFYIIHSGMVRVFLRDKEGVETDLSILGPGESFGEVALLTGKPRSANVLALEETRLTVLPKEEFEHILKDFPDISAAFLKEIAESLLRDDRLLETEIESHFKPPRLQLLDFLLIVGLSILLGIVYDRSNPNGIALLPKMVYSEAIPEVTPSVAQEECKNDDCLFLDAMPAGFYEQKHIKGAVNLPTALFDIMYAMDLNEKDREKRIIVYGRTVSALYDEEVAGKLILRGYKRVEILKGGLSAWKKQGYPVEP
jgi:CRP-like cAMP-binding protein/rhodanese-related sulfurtransferase